MEGVGGEWGRGLDANKQAKPKYGVRSCNKRDGRFMCVVLSIGKP